MIQGDNILGNSNYPEPITNMDFFDRDNIAPPLSVENSLYENTEISMVIPDDTLSHINTEDLLQYTSGENLEILERESFFYEEKTAPVIDGDVLPDLSEHDDGGLEFELIIEPHENRMKNNWYYSTVLQKLFIKLDKTFYIDISHKNIDSKLFLRIMMVFSEDISSPVKRCQNHIAGEPGTINNISEKNIVVRSENPDSKYYGTEVGKNVKDRLSVLIPLNYVKPNEKNMSQQSIAVKFVCQNSCIGRKQTSVIFLLEDSNTKCLAKRVLNLKVCSCPKRDKSSEEEKCSQKRKVEEDEKIPYGKRPMKYSKIKEEPGILSPPLSSPAESDDNILNFQSPPPSIQPNIAFLTNGGVNVTFNLPNQHIAREVLNNAFNSVSGEMARKPRDAEKLMPFLQELRSLIEKC